MSQYRLTIQALFNARNNFTKLQDESRIH
jgi:hypothetical protein